MNRNNELHFNQVPEIHSTRTRFKRDQDVKTTFDAGQLVPIFVDEVLPGDTYDIDLNGIVRMATPIFPVMDNLYLDVYAFFVPNRIVWDHFKEFMGEASDQPWTPSSTEQVPQLLITGANSGNNAIPEELSLLDYMGVPTKIFNDNLSINALPVRGYVKIWNEWFRDQNIDNPATVTYDDATVEYMSLGDTTPVGGAKTADPETRILYANSGRYTLPVNRFHDYFSSCLPAPQRGDPVQIPGTQLSGFVPIQAYGYGDGGYPTKTSTPGFYAKLISEPIQNTTTKSSMVFPTSLSSQTATSLENSYHFGQSFGNDDYFQLYMGSTTDQTSSDALIKRKGASLWANLDLASQLGAASIAATTINQLREAFQIQRFLEQSARAGSRYRELVRSFFDVTLSDKTVQIPEYLGGDRFMINVSQVIQTSASNEQSPQGNAAAISVTPFAKHLCTKSFEEHGFIYILGCIRHDRTYQQGLERFWSRKDRLDYYFPVFAHLGEQAVLNKEIYVEGGDNDDKAFGYQEAWADYRMKPNRVTGAMRSNYNGTLDSWHYADNYEERPTLSTDWLKEGKYEIERTLAVQDEPQFIADFYVANKTTRVMPLYSVPGLIDHM